MSKKESEFRMWVQDLYFQNVDERIAYGEERRDFSQYFRKYRWWLRREYQYQKGKKL